MSSSSPSSNAPRHGNGRRRSCRADDMLVQLADIRLNAEMKRSDPFNVLWLQAGSCGGCTMSALESGAAGWFEELFAFGVELLWHPSVSEATGGEALAILDSVERGARRLDALV